ncbi:MAG: UDP-N-acetylmuramoyl-L-alanine--D-glutamate ligase [Gammaproteobacteria bacterium]|nr:UDP-N-acetylmuramoyl-L-alanine--D-glutamate ligase [Gammaproteobacteria bacterium]
MPAGNESGLSTVVKAAREKTCLLQGNPSHAVVIGLGRSGLATAVFLSRKGLQVDVYDSSDAPALSAELSLQAPDVHIICGTLAVERWSDDSLLVVSPGVPLSHPELAPLLNKGVRPLGDIELFAQCVQSPVIAITGSNGKSTVTVLLGEILKHAERKVAVGGNIGVPILELLDDEKNDIYVLELSSFQLETTWTLNPVIATVLNIAADHMDRYAGLDEYIASKAKVFNGSGKMLLNADDPVSEKLLQGGRETIYFGSTAPVAETDYGLSELDGALYLTRGEQSLMAVADIHLSGQHNLLNVLAAWALASNVGIEDRIIKEAVAKFSGLPHRMEWLATVDDVDWINDSKGTNVGATVAAIKGLHRPVILIAGGIAKDADFSPLRQVMAGHVKEVVLIGRDADKIAADLSGMVTIKHAADMQEAVLLARASSQAGDLVLLSPACASFDMYKNYEHRGDEFRRCVEGLY